MSSIKQVVIVVAIISFLFISTSFASRVNASQDSWVTLEPMPTARSLFGVAVVEGKIYAIGGTNGSIVGVNEMYDPTTNIWTTKTPMPTPRYAFGLAVYQNKIYVIGGAADSSNSSYSGYTGITEVYDPLTDTWETKQSMPTPRTNFELNVVDDKIYVIGGLKYRDLYPYNTGSTVNEVYDITNDAWTTKTPIPRTCTDSSSVTVDNKIYIMGGWPLSITYNLTQIYDTETDTWNNGKNLTTGSFASSAGITSGLLAPEKIYILGGETRDTTALNVTRVYDFQNDTWTLGAAMPTSRYGLEVAVVNDELHAIGGKNENKYLDTNEKYIPIGYIPEIPSWLVVPVFVASTLFTVVAYRQLKKRT